MKQKFYLLFIVCFGAFLLNACKRSYTYNAPSEAFYISDQINALLPATKWRIYANSEGLYEDSLKASWIPDNKRGAQVVVVTLDSQEQLNTTTLFNVWKIGKNDMGLLIVLYYDTKEEFPELKYIDYEAGFMMMNYFPALQFSLLIDEYLEPEKSETNLMQFYFEVISYIYVNIYEYESFSYNLENYLDSMYDSYDYPSDKPQKASLPLWVLIIIYLLLPSLGIGIFVGYRKTVGGAGGKSLGYKFRR